ncbi:MAG TPA: hypothetical protein VND64_01755 [Pirellulales bacterium]|nr:hypothetical protein [Pirellulales bacterium]
MAKRLCAQATRDGTSDDKPEWNETEGTLTFLKRRVLDIERGDVERAIVQRFHDLGWPTLIDDGVAHYVGNHARRRSNALNRLNERQKPPQIRFFSVPGFGKIGWFPLGPGSSDAPGGGKPLA